jgi:metal-responsive CopG/Arc/MetJ family transcriptional regulator
MKTVSLKLEDTVLVEIEKNLSWTKKTRSRYIAEAIESYNRLQKRILQRRALLEQLLRSDSYLLKNDGLMEL